MEKVERLRTLPNVNLAKATVSNSSFANLALA
jgi:hypothetical protein